MFRKKARNGKREYGGGTCGPACRELNLPNDASGVVYITQTLLCSSFLGSLL